jgi:hypothetical protein
VPAGEQVLLVPGALAVTEEDERGHDETVKARVEAKATENPDAYVLYLRARDYRTRPIPLMQDKE